MRNSRLIGVGVAALTLLGAGAAAAGSVGTVDASKSKAPLTVVEASKSKAPVVVPAKKSKSPVVIVNASKSKAPTTGDVVIQNVSKSKSPVVIVPASMPLPATILPKVAPATILPKARAAVAYTSCGFTTTNGYGSVRVALTVTGTTLVNATMTITNYQDRAVTLDTNRIWDEFGVRKGPGGWIAPGHSLTWTAYGLDGAAGRFWVRGHATTNPSLVDSCSGFLR